MLSVASVTSALDAITAAGGNAQLPTQIVDNTTGMVVAVAQRDASNQIHVTIPDQPSRSFADVVQTVTGWIDQLAGTITSIGTQLQKTGNAIQGGAAGAQAGYNMPTSATPYLIVGIGVLSLLLLTGRRR